MGNSAKTCFNYLNSTVSARVRNQRANLSGKLKVGKVRRSNSFEDKDSYFRPLFGCSLSGRKKNVIML